MTTTSIDLGRWPGLTDVPTGPKARIAAAIARRLFFVATRRLGVSVTLTHSDAAPTLPPLGGANTDTGPHLRIHRPEEFFLRVGNDGLIGFGESYMTGAWDADDLGDSLAVLAREISTLVPAWMQRLRATYVSRPPRHQRNTERNTRGNIAAHYDLSNDLFATFLDPSLSYSSALFATGEVAGDGDGHSRVTPPDPDSDLHAAQLRKIDRLLDRAGVGPGSRVLEIGTGWGELAIRAAARGATVRSVTLSSEQQALAQQRIAEAGHADAVTVDLLDYRAVDGEYDAVVSVEMIEAVGYEYWPTYFAKIDSVLAPGGVAAIQAITMPHDRMLATRRTWTWINKYIFPGGFLPSTEAIDEITRAHTSLRVTDRLSMGSHYAETLRQWDHAFRNHEQTWRRLGFDTTFGRMWHFYLEYSRAGFASGYIDVQQITLQRPTEERA